MTTVGNVVAGDDDVQWVRRWVRLSCTEPGTHLPALAEIAGTSGCRRLWFARRWSSSPPKGW